MRNFQKKNILIAKFMGFKYYRKGVWYDHSDIGGIYNQSDVYSKIPIKILKNGNDIYFSCLKNPDFGNLNSKRFDPNIEFLDWEVINSGKYVFDLKYYDDFNALFGVLNTISALGYEYTVSKFGCSISKYSDFLKEDENIIIAEDPSVDIKINIFNAIYGFVCHWNSLKIKKAA